MAVRNHDEKAHESPSSSAKKPGQRQFLLPLNIAFYLLLLSNTIAASLVPIQDCDETYNYWEPVHYLDHQYGFQTWEYSPEYSIRSWLYVLFHASIGKAASIFTSDKTSQFYVIRCVLGFLCTACELRLYSAISRSLNAQIGVLFVLITIFSTGMHHASIAMLPSSFAMLCAMLGLSAFIDWKGKNQTARGIMWFGLGAIVGWPFAGVLMVPFILEVIYHAIASSSVKTAVVHIIKGGIGCLLILNLEIAVDSLFYRRLTVVPWNIVAYNIFGGQGRGPDIYGVEPWTFYFQNLALNFNLWFVLALSAGPLLLFHSLVRSNATTRQTVVHTLTLISPFYMWFAIFTAQPHKEERFMYPLYPFLCLNASLSLHILISYAVSDDRKELIGRVPLWAKLGFIVAALVSAISLGILRTVGMITAYSAPMKVLQPLQNAEFAQAGSTVCLGKEWYRFPSSFHLPNGMRGKFIKSEFKGLLPGEFAQHQSNIFYGSSVIPSGMNDLNIEDPSKYTDISHCDFIMDLSSTTSSVSALEPNYALDTTSWEKVACYPFLDTARTPTLARIIWVPNLSFLSPKLQRVWADYCLLRRRNHGAL
ncbi:mannosyltransferase [Ascosphaera aggregata]|nr:mannosyltransferase [Ascosphaera aggregata]